MQSVQFPAVLPIRTFARAVVKAQTAGLLGNAKLLLPNPLMPFTWSTEKFENFLKLQIGSVENVVCKFEDL